MSVEQGGVARYRLVGVTDERDSCDCYGRTDLKRVVVLHDGDDHLFFGSHRAARLLGKPVSDVNRGNQRLGAGAGVPAGSPATRRRSPAAAMACRSATAPPSTATWRPPTPRPPRTRPRQEGGRP